MIDPNYVPYGEEWEKEVAKLLTNEIEIVFGMKRRVNEKKKNFIRRIGKEKSKTK
jgi:hypothetical protein